MLCSLFYRLYKLIFLSLSSWAEWFEIRGCICHFFSRIYLQTAHHHLFSSMKKKIHGRRRDSKGYCLDFRKAIDIVPRNIFIGKLMVYRMDEQTVRWIENWLNSWAQRILISGKHSWRPETSVVPQYRKPVIIGSNNLQHLH